MEWNCTASFIPGGFFLSFPPPHPHALELTEECQVGRKGKAESGGAGEGGHDEWQQERAE